MNDWIPTTERLPNQNDNGQVWVTHSNTCDVEIINALDVNKKFHLAWKAREQKPKPYVLPKPERRKWRWKPGNCVRVICPATSIELDGCHIREVLPGDPDPDVVLEALAKIKQWCNAPNDRAYARIMDLCNRIEASRETK